jgi:hypothetical protein
MNPSINPYGDYIDHCPEGKPEPCYLIEFTDYSATMPGASAIQPNIAAGLYLEDKTTGMADLNILQVTPEAAVYIDTKVYIRAEVLKVYDKKPFIKVRLYTGTTSSIIRNISKDHIDRIGKEYILTDPRADKNHQQQYEFIQALELQDKKEDKNGPDF